MLWPSTRLETNGHYIVAVRDLVDTSGRAIEPSEAFTALRCVCMCVYVCVCTCVCVYVCVCVCVMCVCMCVCICVCACVCVCVPSSVFIQVYVRACFPCCMHHVTYNMFSHFPWFYGRQRTHNETIG